MISIYTQNKYIQKKLTAFDGELVGASVGLRGAFDGDWLGFDVGCNKTDHDHEAKSKC